MATHQCYKKEHALMEHTVLKLFWDLDTWLIALAYWMLHCSEGNGDFEFWFTVWPDKIPMLHPPRWMGLLVLTDGAIARNSPTSQHNFWYPVGTRCWQCKCCACVQQMQGGNLHRRLFLPCSLPSRSDFNAFFLQTVDRQIKTYPESWMWIAVCADHIQKAYL